VSVASIPHKKKAQATLLHNWDFTPVGIDFSHQVAPDVTKGHVVCLQLFTSGVEPMW